MSTSHVTQVGVRVLRSFETINGAEWAEVKVTHLAKWAGVSGARAILGEWIDEVQGLSLRALQVNKWVHWRAERECHHLQKSRLVRKVRSWRLFSSNASKAMRVPDGPLSLSV